jgi:hypothetical protein
MAHCTFTVSDWTTGGKLTGGFDDTTQLGTGQTLQVSVLGPVGNAPSVLHGVFVFTAEKKKGGNQTSPSPFTINNSTRPQCLAELVAQGTGDGVGHMRYDFAAFTYNGGYPGAYELTFVCFPDAGSPQWSEDPEFDTGS